MAPRALGPVRWWRGVSNPAYRVSRLAPRRASRALGATGTEPSEFVEGGRDRRHWYVESVRETHDRLPTRIACSAFDVGDVRRVHLTRGGELLLRHPSCQTHASQCLADEDLDFLLGHGPLTVSSQRGRDHRRCVKVQRRCGRAKCRTRSRVRSVSDDRQSHDRPDCARALDLVHLIATAVGRQSHATPYAAQPLLTTKRSEDRVFVSRAIGRAVAEVPAAVACRNRAAAYGPRHLPRR